MVTTGARGSKRALFVLLADEAGLDVGLGHALGRVAELLHDELGGIDVDHIVDFVHRAFLHQILDDVDGALGHAVGQLLDGDDLGDHHFADDLLARLGDAHRLELLALALALQRGQRAFALLLVEGVVDRQLDALALFVAAWASARARRQACEDPWGRRGCHLPRW